MPLLTEPSAIREGSAVSRNRQRPADNPLPVENNP
jgi:hypothetical protein